jgi:phospholipid/cholesterol/gamma-HCH transport system ATP-binding protein
MARRTSIVQVKDLVTHYGPTLVLNGVSFEVEAGEILAVVGASGCGKSTLLKHVIGLLAPSSGSIELWGTDIARLDAEQLAVVQSRFGVSFQSGGLFNSMTLYDNIALPLRERRMLPDDVVDKIVRAKLAMVGLERAQYVLPSELSGGMKKRAGFARALALDPELVFFDEPSAGLDPITAAGLDELVLDLRSALGLTVVVITHELESIKKVADRVLMLDRGEVVFYGLQDEIEKSDNARLKQFFSRQPDEAMTARDAAQEA